MRGFDQYRRRLSAQLTRAVTNAAERAARDAKSLVPYGDGDSGGHLRDCIFARTQAKDGLFCGDVCADNPHALFVEMGTSRMAAQPYLRPALRGGRASFLYDLR